MLFCVRVFVFLFVCLFVVDEDEIDDQVKDFLKVRFSSPDSTSLSAVVQ